MDPTPAKRQKLNESDSNVTDITTVSKHEASADVETASDERDTRQAAPTEEGKGEKRELPDGYNTDKRLTETDVGITEYISQLEGFSGILKLRYSDFVVNEVAEDGHMVRITDLSVPEEEFQETVTPTERNCIAKEDQLKLQALIDTKDKSGAVCIKVGNDKEERTKIHKAIRTCFPGLESTTEEDGLQKLITVKLQNAAGSRNQRRSRWPQGRGDYCKFVLSKENKDTMDALNLIAKLVRIKPNMFSYAGTKDRRAKTSQEVTVYRVSAETLKDVNRSLRNMAMGNFRYCQKPLHLGQLQGNRFTIILREVTGEETQIEAAMKSLGEVGFINYYGMQRFGTTSVPTHHIGRALLCSRWQEAVELILKPRNEDDAQMAECRRVWWETRDAQKALTLVCKQNCIEQSLLRGLLKSGSNNYASALNSIPRNTRTMYVHSYQSFVWNSVVSRRLKQLGLKPVIGDLLLDRDIVRDEDETVQPVMVTDDNIGNYGIHDVVLPLPGYDINLPQNSVAEWYEHTLKEDGMSLEHFKHNNKDYALRGAYRKIVVKPEDLSWSCHRYNDPNIQLVCSDLEELNGVVLQNSPEDGKSKALRMDVTLPTSCYATMAVREILKMDTSSAFQATLNPT